MVGHVEWVTFVPVEAFPKPGSIVHATAPPWDDAGGGGAVAAVELARLGADVTFFTALGDPDHDPCVAAAEGRLRSFGVEVRAAHRAEQPQRRGWTLLDPSGERTIVIAGERQVPVRSDALGWGDLARFDAVYFTGGDARALHAARRARRLVATSRARGALGAPPGVALDALVLSGNDPDEALDPARLPVPPRATVSTLGHDGGRWVAGTEEGHWATVPLPGPRRDAYGAGDCFAAGLTFALGEGRSLAEAVESGAASGAEAMTREGAYGRPASSASSGA